MKVAVTGASGYLGSELCRKLAERGHIPIALVARNPIPGILNRRIENITDESELAEAIVDCDSVIHLAAISHRRLALDESTISSMRETNVDYTRALARASIRSRISRFIFVSSIKVNGERTNGKPFRADDTPNPEDIYGITKLEAESVLRKLALNPDFKPIIIRPPLIYGGKAKGNLATLIGAVSRGVPLPLAGIRNKRSLVSLPLICDFIEVCLTHPDAPGQTFLVSDGVPRSTPEIIRMVSGQQGYSARLFYCPRWILDRLGRMLGKMDMMSRLTNDLVIDMEPTREKLGWDPASKNARLDER